MVDMFTSFTGAYYRHIERFAKARTSEVVDFLHIQVNHLVTFINQPVSSAWDDLEVIERRIALYLSAVAHIQVFSRQPSHQNLVDFQTFVRIAGSLILHLKTVYPPTEYNQVMRGTAIADTAAHLHILEGRYTDVVVITRVREFQNLKFCIDALQLSLEPKNKDHVGGEPSRDQSYLGHHCGLFPNTPSGDQSCQRPAAGLDYSECARVSLRQIH